MPRKGEALIIDSMPAMAQFVFDLYNTKLEQIKSSMPVSIHYYLLYLQLINYWNAAYPLKSFTHYNRNSNDYD